MLYALWVEFGGLIVTPFQHISLLWGIVPLYFALLLNELTSAKASYRTAIQTGFSFLWAGAQWLYPYCIDPVNARLTYPAFGSLTSVNLVVTFAVILLGLAALVSGIRKRFPKHGWFLGHTRFSNYFMITIFPIQAHFLAWTWPRLAAISLFAIPAWLLLHFGLMPLRNK